MSLVRHCKSILEQNLLKADENLVVATPHKYDAEFMSALLQAASEIGATGAHVTVVPKIRGNEWVSGLTSWHWDLYASADLLITTRIGTTDRREVPPASTAYVAKVGNHPYRTDHEYINRPGSKTRWLDLMMPIHLQRQYFPTPERARLTLEGAMLLHKKKEVRVTSKAGSDWTAKKVTRPGHAQYGIADAPGRWDNFGYGCVACMPEDDSAEGTLVLEPGDIIPPLKPLPIVTEPVKLTFKGGYVTKVEGGITAKRFDNYIASFNDKESYGFSHIGWGTHEKATLGEGTDPDISAYHHNAIGTILFSLGVNFGHGIGGPEVKYSGGGMTTRKSAAHIHFTMLNVDFYCDDEKVVEDGKLLMR